MTRQEEFRKKMASLFEEYGVEMKVEETISGYSSYVSGVSFYSWRANDDGGTIDFEVDAYVTAENFK